MALVRWIVRACRLCLNKLARSSSGQVPRGYVILAAIVVGSIVAAGAVSNSFGRRAERTYRDSIDQLAGNGIEVTVNSYDRGLFSSQAVATVQLGQSALTLVQHISHGPLTITSGLRPVAATIDTTIQAPAAYTQGLQTIFGNVSPHIYTVVTFDGVLDTFISLPSSANSIPLIKCIVISDGLNYEWYISPDIHRFSGQGPTLTVTGGCGEFKLTGLTANGESHLESGHRVGNTRLAIQQIGGASHMPGQDQLHGMVRDFSFTTLHSLKNSRMDLAWKWSVASVAAGSFELGPMALESDLSNVDADSFTEFAREAEEVRKSKLAKDAQTRLLTEKAGTFVVAMVKQSPALAFGLHITSPEGATVGRANLGIAPALVNDPRLARLKDPTPADKDLMQQLMQQYGYAYGDLSVPRAFAARAASADNLRQWETSGMLKREGANFVSHFTYKSGVLLVNGKKIEPPKPQPKIIAR
jgi:uncharacterized protein YdgA (DUF945 family)